MDSHLMRCGTLTDVAANSELSLPIIVVIIICYVIKVA